MTGLTLFAPRWLMATGILFTALSTSVGAVESSGALAATRAVVIEIDGVDEELAAYGLSRASIVKAMTSRIESAGVNVISGSQLEQQGAAVLRLRVRLMRTLHYFYLYNVNLTLGSKVPLEGKDAYTIVPTWSDGWVGSLQPTDVGLIENHAAELLSRFLAARAGETGR